MDERSVENCTKSALTLFPRHKQCKDPRRTRCSGKVDVWRSALEVKLPFGNSRRLRTVYRFGPLTSYNYNLPVKSPLRCFLDCRSMYAMELPTRFPIIRKPRRPCTHTSTTSSKRSACEWLERADAKCETLDIGSLNGSHLFCNDELLRYNV